MKTFLSYLILSIYAGAWRWILGIGMLPALAVAVFYYKAAANRGKGKADILYKVLPTALLSLGGFILSFFLPRPDIPVLACLLMPMLVYSILYPLLYIKWVPRIWRYLYLILSVYFTLTAFWSVLLHLGQSISPALLLIAGIATTVIGLAFTWMVFRKVKDDVCPHCGFYAAHGRGDVQHEGDTVKKESVSWTDGKEQTPQQQKEVTTVFSHYSVQRTCMHCGKAFNNNWTKKTTSE